MSEPVNDPMSRLSSGNGELYTWREDFEEEEALRLVFDFAVLNEVPPVHLLEAAVAIASDATDTPADLVCLVLGLVAPNGIIDVRTSMNGEEPSDAEEAADAPAPAEADPLD